MRALVLTILGRNAEKQIEAALHCTSSQAHEIVQRGKCPRALYGRLVEFLERTVAFRRAEFDQADRELKEMRRAAELLANSQRMQAEATRAIKRAGHGELAWDVRQLPRVPRHGEGA